jgi:Flp pilus assembly protein TadG
MTRGGQMTVSGENRSKSFGAGGLLARLIGDRRGAAAIEFAFIAPLLLSLYFVTMEVSQGIEANKKVSRVGSMVGDLVTQQQTINKSEVEAILRIGESTLQPYNRTKPEIIVTAIEITDETTPKTRVVWSRKLMNGAFSEGPAKLSTTTVPTKLSIKGTFLIRVESKLAYAPVITWSADQKDTLGLTAAFSGISMKEDYYLRPRLSTTIPCSDC